MKTKSLTSFKAGKVTYAKGHVFTQEELTKMKGSLEAFKKQGLISEEEDKPATPPPAAAPPAKK